MRKEYTAFLHWFSILYSTRYNSGGKITVAAMLSVALVVVTSFGAYFELFIPSAHATPVSTAVTVLNTPPAWTVGVQESAPGSATTTPTNAGAVLSFTATATNGTADPYWLIICSASSTPVAHTASPPTCSSGFQWAISATTTSASSTIAATTTVATAPFNNENNAWYGYVCNADPTGGLCNPVGEQGTPGAATASPFVIDHPPVFANIVNSGGVNPGSSETWTATAYSTDVLRGGDTVQLFVCKTNAFNTASTTCSGGAWATSTLAASNPSTSTAIAIPTQDANYPAYVFVANNFGVVATSTFEGYNSWYSVNSVAPTILPASIIVNGGSAMILTAPAATSGPFTVTFTVNDNNSCQSASSTNEIASVIANVYENPIATSTSCLASGQYNSNSCYPNSSTLTGMTCAQVGGSCSGPLDTTADFSCTFNLWYNADPTDTGSAFLGGTWLGAASSSNWKGVNSTLVQGSSGTNVNSLTAFNVTKTSISYGGLTPGNSVALSTTTDLVEQGNTGLDENLYGDTMCTTWTGQDSCDAGGPSATTKITVNNQEFATSSVAYNAVGQAFPLTASTSPSLVGIHVQKTTATSTPFTKNTFWGILVPGTITLAGNYSGQDTIIGVESSSTNW
jgi:hypothetical protein